MNYCNSCCSYNCGCGCNNKIIAYQSNQNKCCSSSQSAINTFCNQPLTYVTSNFTVPAANVAVEVSVSDATKLYVGQGIRIGTGDFQITEVADMTTINIAHNGTATPNTTIKARHPSYGCYQYPIFYVGYVGLLFEPEVAGLDASFVVIADSIVDPVIEMVYGYLGPKKVQFAFEVIFEGANSPIYLEVELPVAAGTASAAAFSAVVGINGVSYDVAFALREGDTILAGVAGTVTFGNDPNTVFKISGEYDIE